MRHFAGGLCPTKYHMNVWEVSCAQHSGRHLTRGQLTPITGGLTREGIQGQVEQVVGAAHGPQDSIVADDACTEQELAFVALSSAIGDVGKDVKVTAHSHVLAHTDPHGHSRFLLSLFLCGQFI